MSDRLRTAAIALSVLGLAIAGYLTYVHYAGVSPVCEIAHGCEKVQTSQWSKVVGVPVALLGLLGYAAILVAVLAPGETALVAAAGAALVGAGFVGAGVVGRVVGAADAETAVVSRTVAGCLTGLVRRGGCVATDGAGCALVTAGGVVGVAPGDAG